MRRGLLLGLVLVMAGCSVVGDDKDYTIVPEEGDSDSLIYDKDTTPLSAKYDLGEVYTTPIKIHVKGKTSDMDIIHCAVFDTTEIPIHGLYQDHTNEVVITVEEENYIKREITIEIPVDDLGIANATIHTDNLPDPDPWNQDLYFMGVQTGSWQIYVYDRKGDVRYYNKDLGYYASISYIDGQILIKHNLGIYDLFGNTIVDYKATTHHDNIQLDNGNYVVLAISTWGFEDRVVELDSGGNIIAERDRTFGSLFRDIVTGEEDLAILNRIIYDDDNIRQVNGVDTVTDWAHANSLVYDSDTDIMYFSLRMQGVIAVDYSEWKLLWWMADDTLNTLHAGVPNVGCNFTKVKSLEPYRVMGAGKTDGPKNQHALFLLENGNLAMFDNQGDVKPANGGNPDGSRYVEYEISGSQGSWTATKEDEYRDSSLYSRVMSDVDFTGEGNLLMAWAELYRIREINLDTVLFDISTKVVSWGLYRADKMPLYPYMDKNKKYSEEANLLNK